jgi:GAF domain-containing protein
MPLSGEHDRLASPSAARVDATTQALNDLRDIFEAEEPLGVVLERVATGAALVIPQASAVTITVLIGDGPPQTLAWTDPRYLDIDARQYAADRGPCLDAARTHHPVRADVARHSDRWPEFSEAARLAGVRAYLSAPLVAQKSDTATEWVGSINTYSGLETAFDPFDEALMVLFTTEATQAIGNAHRWQRSREETRNLRLALDSRAVIDQAKGVLMAIHRCGAEEAFNRLVDQSQRRNVKVRQVAVELLDYIAKAD